MENPYRKLSSVNPQRDNGHRQINNEIWQALMLSNLTGSEYKIIMLVIDRAWGYNKTEVSIGYTTIMKATGLTKPSIRDSIKKLQDKHILITEKGNFKDSTKYLLNKYYDTWTSLPVKNINTGKLDCISPGKVNSTTPGKVPLRSFLTTKENLNKTLNKGDQYTNNLKRKKTGGLYNPDKDNPDRLFQGKYGHLVLGGKNNEKA